MQAKTRYARSGGVNIAYQVVGESPRDLVLIHGWVSNVEVFWEEPSAAGFLERLASTTPCSSTSAVWWTRLVVGTTRR
jgi:pimeloyl-ACP methyl ester carboxylesterase